MRQKKEPPRKPNAPSPIAGRELLASSLQETAQERTARKERIELLQAKVWDNLRSSGLLGQILGKSAHAADISRYVGVRFWAEIGGSKMVLQLYIQHEDHRQPVTPKIYRMTRDPEEQRRLSEQIWSPIAPDDLLFIISVKARMFHKRDELGWLAPHQESAIRAVYLAIQKDEVSIELNPSHAQYDVTRQ